MYAPLAGCSDFPFRMMAARYKPALMFCEMVKVDPLVRGLDKTLQMLKFHESMRPIGAQLCGSRVDLFSDAARRIEELGFDLVDLNCGCPVDKVTKDGGGSALLKDPDRIGNILMAMKSAVSIPVTLKIRIGWDDDHIVAMELVKIAEEVGAAAIFVHARTREQGYTGPARWEYIRACVETARNLPVIGNGDVFSPEAALRMFQETKCQGVLVSRGTMGDPWIAEQIQAAMTGSPVRQRTKAEYKQALLDHLLLSEEYKSEREALIDMRKVCCWYLKETEGARQLRAHVSQIESLSAIKELVNQL